MSFSTIIDPDGWSEGCSNIQGSYGVDPTILLRLHSLMSGKDIFILSEKYNYNAQMLNREQAYLILSEDFIYLLMSINDNNFLYVSEELYKSPEANLYGWDLPTVKHFIYSLINEVSISDNSFLLCLSTQEESNDV